MQQDADQTSLAEEFYISSALDRTHHIPAAVNEDLSSVDIGSGGGGEHQGRASELFELSSTTIISLKSDKNLPFGNVDNGVLHDPPEITVGIEGESRWEETWHDGVDLTSAQLVSLLTLIPRGPKPAARRRVRCDSAALD